MRNRTDVNALTFGIEIECTIPYSSLRQFNWAVGGYHAGCNVPNFAGWKTMHDGSIQATKPGHEGVEVVSPVLRGLDGIRQIERMVEQLHVMGADVNRSTGFHVHVGWSGSNDRLRRLVCFVAHHEKALFASTGTTSRDRNTYCSSIKARRHDERVDYRTIFAEGNGVTPNVADVNAHFSRYHTLNLTNLSRPASCRTVEFRVFAGTLNVVKMLAYVQLCLGIVVKALDGRQLPFDTVAIERKRRATAGDGQFAMSLLLQSLVWRKKTPPNGRKPVGVIDSTRMESMIKVLRKMARQYDKRTGSGE